MSIKVTNNLTKVTISTTGVQGPKGEKGDTIQGGDISALVVTSSFNSFTGSYLSDSASFANRINLATNEQNISGLAVTSSNVFTGEQTAPSFNADNLIANDKAFIRRIGGIANTPINVESDLIASASIYISGSIIPSTGLGTFTSSFSLGSITNAWKDLYISHGSIIFVDAVTQRTSSFTISTDPDLERETVQYTAAITASAYLGDGSKLTNIKSSTAWYDGAEITLLPTEEVTLSNDLVLENTQLILTSESKQYNIAGKIFKKCAKIFIGGDLLVVNSYIQNNGQINVAGSIILSGSSVIEGTGIID